MSDNTCWVCVSIKLTTDAAVKVESALGEAWIPRSQIIDHEDELERGATIEIEIARWLAETEGLV